MYKKNDGQITLAEFYSPFGKLDQNNRWVRIADLIPWEKLEATYAQRFCKDNGAPAINFRMAMGTLIIKQNTGHSDDDVLQDIVENPYMQYLIGLNEFTTTAPFAQSSITNFRKYIPAKMIIEVNEYLFRNTDEETKKKEEDFDNDNDSSGSSSEKKEEPPNKGTLMHDATCAPANIKYPTDVNLLNEAREKLEELVDMLHPHTGNKIKPRTYRKKARQAYMQFSKQRKPRKKSVRKAVGQQLRYVKRDINHVLRLIGTVGREALSERQLQCFKTIQALYEQQQKMYETKIHSIDNRIVSISQPHVRPIVRGKSNAAVEFGAKVGISLIDGYAYVDKIGWDAYNEESLLIPAIEAFKAQHGHYPESVLADKIYRNRTNLSYCKAKNIRLSGPRLGRPSKGAKKEEMHQTRKDAAQRNAIEGKFGEGKTGYGLDRIMARLQDSSETVIAMSFLCMNISRRLRVLCRFFADELLRAFGCRCFETGAVFE